MWLRRTKWRLYIYLAGSTPRSPPPSISVQSESVEHTEPMDTAAIRPVSRALTFSQLPTKSQRPRHQSMKVTRGLL